MDESFEVDSLHMESHTQFIVSSSSNVFNETRVSTQRPCQMHFLSSSFSPFHTKRTAFAACLWGALLLALCNLWSSAAHDTPAHTTMTSSAYAHKAMLSSPHDTDISAVTKARILDSVMRISTSDLQSRQALESVIQLAAFQQFDSHKTGNLYNVSVPAVSSGTFQAIRLRSGSLRRYGVTINEFTIPRGCEVSPVPERILLVYARLVNTSLFQSLPGGFALASPVLSVFVYDATNLNSTQSPGKISVSTTTTLISIQFASSSNLVCASFDENSTGVNYTNLTQGACQVDHLGAFALARNVSVPSPSPTSAQSPMSATLPGSGKKNSNTWKIVVGSVVGGLALLILVSLLALGIEKRRKNAKLVKMEYQADQGETLQTTTVKNSRVPAAGDTRTQPTLESDYAV